MVVAVCWCLVAGMWVGVNRLQTSHTGVATMVQWPLVARTQRNAWLLCTTQSFQPIIQQPESLMSSIQHTSVTPWVVILIRWDGCAGDLVDGGNVQRHVF